LRCSPTSTVTSVSILADREVAGWLRPGSAEHARYLELLTTSLRELRFADSGTPLVRDILSGPGTYDDPRSALLPDLVVTWEPAPPAPRVFSERLGAFTARRDTGRSGNHRHEGFAAVVGGSRTPAGGFRQIGDLAPWVLAYFGFGPSS